MHVLRRNKTVSLIFVLIFIILTISVVYLVQNIPKPSLSPTSSPTPINSPSTSPYPTKNSPTPSISATSPPTSTSNSQITPTPFLLHGEVSQYQGQNLTPISFYLAYLNAHPDVAIAGTQFLDQSTYRLAITGLVENQSNYAYDEIVDNFNSTQEVATLPCVEGWSVTMLWQGVPIKEILQQVGVSPNATTLIFVASDGYSTSLPLSYVTQNNISIAYKMNNITLTPQTGWPFFLVAKDQYGYKWIEWLTEINVSNDSNYLGYWESRGYPNNATVLDPKNATQLPIITPLIFSVVIISVLCVVIGVALFVARCKVKKNEIKPPEASGKCVFIFPYLFCHS
jgi:DMSO/TMAO reductase YedYZ molybdopterin-dependent catalytic subunit